MSDTLTTNDRRGALDIINTAGKIKAIADEALRRVEEKQREINRLRAAITSALDCAEAEQVHVNWRNEENRDFYTVLINALAESGTK